MMKHIRSVLAAVAFLSVAIGGSAQVSSTFEGTLHVVWGDARPGSGGAGDVRYTLALPDGRVFPLQLAGHENLAVSHFGKRVIVTGHIVQRFADAATGAIAVDSIAPSPAQSTDPLASAVLGTRKVIFLLAKFQDDTSVPHPPAFYTDLTNPATPPAGEVFPATINGFFLKTSWNQFSWVGDVGGVGGVGAPGGWLTLPHPKSYYAPCGWEAACSAGNLGTLADDAMALGRGQGINFTSYDNVNFVLSNDLDCCAWGGGYYSSVDNKGYGATWEPPWGQETDTYVHEMGHSLGLPHSGWVYYAYDNPWDMMSSSHGANFTLCGSYNSKNDGAASSLYCGEPGDGYIVAHKDYLGWIPTANKVSMDGSAGSSATVTLEAASLPLSSAAKMIKVCMPGYACTGSSARFYTVEARAGGQGTTSQYDNGLPGSGIIIHNVQMDRPLISGPCFLNNQSGWALPVDATPGDYDSVNCGSGGRPFPNYALFNAQWTSGQTYTNGISVHVASVSGSNYVVSVSGPPGAGKSLYLVTPCRLIDTRNAVGPWGGPSLAAATTRNVAAAGQCGIPAGAASLSVNVTAVTASSAGWLTLFPGPAGGAVPWSSTINYVSGKTLANNAIVGVAADGTINVYNSGPYGINFIVDVNGYFQ